MDTEKSNYPEHLEDIEPDDYIIDDTLSSWNREKKPIWKRLVTGSEAPFILMGIGLVVVITLFFLFAPKGESGNAGRQISQLSGRIQQIEEKFAAFETTLQRLPGIENEIASIQKKMNRLESMDASAALRIDRVAKDFKNLKNDLKALSSKTPKGISRPTSTKTSKNLIPKESKPDKKSPPIVESKKNKKQLSVVKSKPAPKQSTVAYHQVKKDETLYRISRQYGVSVETIFQLNGLKKGAAIYPGQKLIIKP
jgi:LysM repeat protein